MGKIELKNGTNNTKNSSLKTQEALLDSTKIVSQEKVKTTLREEPYIISEDEARRNKYERHFRMSDGTYQAVIYPKPVNYFDEEQKKYFPIDNNVAEEKKNADSVEDFDGFCNRGGVAKVKFAKSIYEKYLL